MSRLYTTGYGKSTIDDEILTIFALQYREATNWTHTEYLDENANSADTVNLQSSVTPINDQLDGPLSPEEIALSQSSIIYVKKWKATSENRYQNMTSIMLGSSYSSDRTAPAYK